jgi:hypothetical protein
VVGEQLEHENGVDVYSFEVRPNQKSGTVEVNVDANSGAIVAVENQDRKHEDGDREDDERDDDGPAVR